MGEIVYLNGEFIPKEQALISIDDGGFLYGFGIFETMRAYNGKVFRLSKHLDRLEVSQKLVGLKLDIGTEELRRIVEETVKRNRLSDAYVRMTLSSGVEKPTVVVFARSLEKYLKNYKYDLDYYYQNGMRAVKVSERSNPHSLVTKIKSLNYLQNLIAKKEAKEKGADEAILINTSGYVSEGAASNLFLVQGGRVFTPPLEAGLLPGVTREVVEELADEAGIELRETEFRLEEMRAADECFLTNSMLEVMPVTDIDDHAIGDGRPGKITAILRESYRELVSQESK